MWMRWLTAGGMFVLGVLATMAIEAMTGKALNVILRERLKRRSRRRLERFRVDDDLVRRGHEALYIHQFVPGGYEPEDIELILRPSRGLREALDEADTALLPATVDELVEEVARRRIEYDRPDTLVWNGESVAVEHIEPFTRRGAEERPVLKVVVHPSDYAASQVCTQRWQEWFDASDGRLPTGLPQLYDGIPGMLHAIGLNATLVTSDDKLILVRRSPRMSSGRSGWHIAVNEGMLPTDRATGSHLDPHLGLVRGVHEELGLDVPQRAVRFHTAMFDMRRYQFGLLGHVDLRGTAYDAAGVVAARQAGLPRDKKENDKVEVVDWDIDTVRGLLAEADWIAHGWLNLLLSAVAAFPRHSTELVQLLGGFTESAQAREDAARLARSSCTGESVQSGGPPTAT